MTKKLFIIMVLLSQLGVTVSVAVMLPERQGMAGDVVWPVCVNLYDLLRACIGYYCDELILITFLLNDKACWHHK